MSVLADVADTIAALRQQLAVLHAELPKNNLVFWTAADELRPTGARHESMLYAARIEAGLRQFLTDGGFAAFTTNLEDLGGLRQLPGLAVQRPTVTVSAAKATGKPPSCCTPTSKKPSEQAKMPDQRAYRLRW